VEQWTSYIVVVSTSLRLMVAQVVGCFETLLLDLEDAAKSWNSRRSFLSFGCWVVSDQRFVR